MANRSIGSSANHRNTNSPRWRGEQAPTERTPTTTGTTATVTTTTTTNTTTTTTTSSTAITATPRAPTAIPTPTLSILDMPTDIIGGLIAHLRTRQSDRDFAFDVRNFSLVSRRLNGKVFSAVSGATGEAFRDAWKGHGNQFNAAMFLKDCTAQVSQPGRKKRNPFASGTRPPKGLKELMKTGETLELSFGAQKDQEPVYKALIEWGKQLPLSRLIISCDAFSSLQTGEEPDKQFLTHLGMLIDLLTVFSRHPNAKSMNIVLRVRGCGRVLFCGPNYLYRILDATQHFVRLVVETEAVKEIDLWDVPRDPSWQRLTRRADLITRRDDRPLTGIPPFLLDITDTFSGPANRFAQ